MPLYKFSWLVKIFCYSDEMRHVWRAQSVRTILLTLSRSGSLEYNPHLGMAYICQKHRNTVLVAVIAFTNRNVSPFLDVNRNVSPFLDVSVTGTCTYTRWCTSCTNHLCHSHNIDVSSILVIHTTLMFCVHKTQLGFPESFRDWTVQQKL